MMRVRLAAPPWYERPAVVLAMQAATVGVVLAAWQAVSGTLVPAFFVSKPTLVFPTVWRWIATGFLWPHLIYTMESTILGFLLGAGTGVAAGLALGLYQNASRVLSPYILALYSIPKIALAPLFVLWFGLDLTPKILVAAFIVFFLVCLNVYAGVSALDEDLLVGVRLMGASRWDELRYLVLPTAAVQIFVGLKTSFPYALQGAVIGEIIASTRGLGYLTMWAKGSFNMTNMFAALSVLMIVAVVITVGLERLERVLLGWRRAEW